VGSSFLSDIVTYGMHRHTAMDPEIAETRKRFMPDVMCRTRIEVKVEVCIAFTYMLHVNPSLEMKISLLSKTIQAQIHGVTFGKVRVRYRTSHSPDIGPLESYKERYSLAWKAVKAEGRASLSPSSLRLSLQCSTLQMRTHGRASERSLTFVNSSLILMQGIP
jgi:hypothetical protein